MKKTVCFLQRIPRNTPEPRLEIKRKQLGELYLKLQGYQQQAGQLYQQKQQDLMAPIQKKASDIVQNSCQGKWIYLCISERCPAGLTTRR